MIEGTIASIMDKGFGFIEVAGYEKNIFFHASECAGVNFEQLRKGDLVSIREIVATPKGYSASKVSLSDSQ